MELIFKEIKYQLRSISFIAFIIIIMLFHGTQFIGDNPDRLKAPEPGLDYYGFTYDVSFEEEMIRGFHTLQRFNSSKSIDSYKPFYKNIKLSEEESIILNDFVSSMVPNYDNSEITNRDIAIDHKTYVTFLEKFDELVGGNTVIGPKYYHPSRKMTYEEAVSEYNDLGKYDNFTNAFARLMSDYFGISAALMIVFLSAFVMLRDKRANVEELVYSSNVNPYLYVSSRFIGLLICIMSVFLLIGVYETIKFSILANQLDLTIDYFAFIKYILVWITPTAMFCIAFPMLISLLLNSSISAIIIQFGISFSLLLTEPLGDSYSIWYLFIRFNSLGNYDSYISNLPLIIANRTFISVISIVLVFITGALWKKKRDVVLMGGLKNEY